MIDWNIRFGDILVVISLIASFMVFAFKSGGFSQSIEAMRDDLRELKENQQRIAEVLMDIAVQKTRIDSVEKRVDTMYMQIEDLRHGRGFILDRTGRKQEL